MQNGEQVVNITQAQLEFSQLVPRNLGNQSFSEPIVMKTAELRSGFEHIHAVIRFFAADGGHRMSSGKER